MFRFVFAAPLCAAFFSAAPGVGRAASGSVTACPEHFAAGVTPVIAHAKLQPRTRALCFVQRCNLTSPQHHVRSHQRIESMLGLEQRRPEQRLDAEKPHPAPRWERNVV